MNAGKQQKIIAVAALVTFGLGFLRATNEGELPSAQFLVGVGLAFTVISIMNDLGSPMGAAFAIIIMIGAILTQFDAAFDLINKRSGGTLKGKRKATRKATKPNQSQIVVPPPSINLPSDDYPHGSQIPTNKPNITVTYL